MSSVSRWGVASLLIGATGCVDTGQEAATVSLYVRGTPAGETILGKSDWAIELGRADVAFGPLYVCAGAQAGKYCDTAHLEWLESVVIDALSGDAREVGTLTGVTGPVRSWMCDLGISSLLTQVKPTVLDAAKELDGNSVVLEGVAQKSPHTITFVVKIPVQLGTGAEIGVSVMAKGSSEPFDHEVASAGDTLAVSFDPEPWIATVDFDGLIRGQSCEAEGCTLNLTLDLESPAGVAVRTAILAGKRPSFSWSPSP